MGRIFKGLKLVLVLIVCTLLMSSVGVQKAHASQPTSSQPSDSGIEGKATPIYTLIYLNGSRVPAANKKEVEEKTKDWQLVYEGITDEDGQLILKNWLTKGEIKIVEEEAPEGYEIIEKEKIVSLEDGQCTFVNKKKEEPKPETPRPVTIPKTGIDSLSHYNSHHPHPDAPQEPEEEETKEDEKANFIIKKVDQEKKPLKGAKFKVYCIPTYEVEFDINLTKVYDATPSGFEDNNQVPPPPSNLTGPKNTSNDSDDNQALAGDFKMPDINLDGPDNNEENQNVPETQEEPCLLMPMEPTRNGNAGTGDDYSWQIDPYSYFIETVITIKVEGNGIVLSDTFEPEKKTVTFRIKPGTYTIYEETTKEGEPKEKTLEQSYLKSYKFKIDEDGNITKVSDSQWQWLKPIKIYNEDGTDTMVYKLDETCTDDNYHRVGVTLQGNNFTIQNHSSEPCPPKWK